MADLRKTPSVQHAVALIRPTVEATVLEMEKLDLAQIPVTLDPGRRLFKPLMEGQSLEWALRQVAADKHEKNIAPNKGLVTAFAPYATEKKVPWFRECERYLFPIGSGVSIPVRPSGFWVEDGRLRVLWAQCWKGRTLERPLVVFLDEAHQFLGQTVGDEYGSTVLDSFGLIAKEGRKYGLTCVLATQRPRDIPHDVLSQLGTLFVHRLTNKQDRDTVESACGDLDRGAAQFIPMLGPGEAIIIGPDLPAPLPVFIHPPTSPPDSRGPSYQSFWRARREGDVRVAQLGDEPIIAEP